MRELNPSIELQELLARQIFNVLQGSVTEIVRQQCEGIGFDVNFRSVMEGNSLKVSETLLPQFYALCQEVKEKLEDLGIAETIDPQPECRSFPQPEIACDQVKAFTQRKQSVEKINILGKFCG